MNKIIWKKIIINNIEFDYEVNNFGDVRRINTLNNLSFGLRGKPNNKYPFVILYKYGKPYHFSVHRLVAQAFIPNPENKPQVNHIDGNKLNNNVSNLEWVTNQENMDHAIKNGLVKTPGKGINAYNCKHTEEEVRKVCELLANKKSVFQISRELNLSLGFIQGIKYQKNWADIRKEYNIPESKPVKYHAFEEIKKLYEIFEKGIRNRRTIAKMMEWPYSCNTISYIKYRLQKWNSYMAQRLSTNLVNGQKP